MTSQNKRLFPVPPISESGAFQAKKKGVWASQHLRQAIEDKAISSSIPIEENQIQPASLDLRLGPVAYEVRASFLPTEKATVERKMKSLLVSRLDLCSGTTLKRGHVYIVPLLEQLHLPEGVAGHANPKSTTGRLDIFTRLIVNYCNEFDRVPAGYRGPAFVEVAPRTFNITVRQGTRLNQLRLSRGRPRSSDTGTRELDATEGVVFGPDKQPLTPRIGRGLQLSVDLTGEHGDPIVGYRAAPRGKAAIDYEQIDTYDPQDFWSPIEASKAGRLVLQPGDFYILASRELVRIPPSNAAEMVAYDPALGEFRVHYAGFFDPGFGYSDHNGSMAGTRAVLEVRSYEVPFILEHGQIVGRLIYSELIEPPTELYGEALGSSYQGQAVALSKQFRGAAEPAKHLSHIRSHTP